MQSKTSFFNIALFKKNISRTWLVGLLYLIVLLIALPVIFVIDMAGDGWGYFASGYTPDMFLHQHMSYMPTTFFSIVVAIIVTGITFWYLFSKRDSYMMHAFPVSRKALYFTGLFSSLTVQVLPVVVTTVIMSIAALAEGARDIACVWYWALIVIVSTFLFTAISMFALMTTGQIVTGIVFYFIFNFLYAMMEIAFRITASLLMFGMGAAMSGLKFNILTPAMFIPENTQIYTFVQTDDMGNKVIDYIHELRGAQYLAIYAVVAVVIIILSYQLYRFKKLETVQDFIAVPFMKPVFSVGMSFFISMVAGAFIAGMIDSLSALRYNAKFAVAIIAAVILGVIIYFATQMMIEKTLRVFSSRTLIHSVIYSVAAIAVLLCMRFDVVKVENKVPAAKDIAWVGICDQYAMTFTDPDEIEAMRQLHKNFLQDKKELRDVNFIYEDVNGNSFTIKYKLKNGTIITRDYSVVDTKSDQVSAEYVAATQPILDFLNDPARIKQHIIGNIWDSGEITDMTFSTFLYDENLQDFAYNSNSFDNLNTKEKKEKFQRVYKEFLKDVDEGKVFVQSFDGQEYLYSGGRGGALYNDFNFTIENKNVEYFSDEDTFYGYYDDYYRMYHRYEQLIYATLTRDCAHTLKALKEEGFYESDDEIITYDEYNQKMGFDEYGYDGLDGGVDDYY